MSAGQRIQKVLADAGLGSRREIEGWIRAGRVTVGGRPAELGQRIAAGEAVSVDGRRVRLPKPEQVAPRVIVYNKPEGEICSRRDPEGRPSVFDALPRLRGSRWVLVGRLDLNTSGLLLATNWGELANRLMHPGYAIEREYLVRVQGEVGEAALARLREGVLLDDGEAAFDEVHDTGGTASNRWFSVVLREGRNREVRRLWESQGVRVSRLKRIRFGPVALSTRERRGAWRELSREEIRALCELVGLKLSRPPSETKTGRRTKGPGPGTARGRPRSRSRPKRRSGV